MGWDFDSMRAFIIWSVILHALLSGRALTTPVLQETLTLKRLSSNVSKRQDQGLNLTISTVRRAFMEEDIDKLASCIGDKKVYVALKSRAGEAGYYTRSQVHFIFEKLFRDRRTRSFEYSPGNITISEEGRAYFSSQWTYMVLDSDTMITEHLQILFEKEKDGWQISEIKASSR